MAGAVRGPDKVVFPSSGLRLHSGRHQNNILSESWEGRSPSPSPARARVQVSSGGFSDHKASKSNTHILLERLEQHQPEAEPTEAVKYHQGQSGGGKEEPCFYTPECVSLQVIGCVDSVNPRRAWRRTPIGPEFPPLLQSAALPGGTEPALLLQMGGTV